MNGDCRYRRLSQRRGSPQCRVAIRGDISPAAAPDQRRGTACRARNTHVAHASQRAASRLFLTPGSLRLPRRSAGLGGRLAQTGGFFYPGSSASRGQKALAKNGDCQVAVEYSTIAHDQGRGKVMLPSSKRLRCQRSSIFSSKDEPEDGGWGFLRSWGSFLVFGFDLGTGE